jgi:hypothetical protein
VYVEENGISTPVDIMFWPWKEVKQYGLPTSNYQGVFRTDIVEAAFNKAQPAESIEKALDALEGSDIDTLAGMFSKTAFSELGSDKIQAGFEYSCNVIEREIVSRDTTNADIYSNIVDGKVQMFLDMCCFVNTDGDERYTVFYSEILIDEAHPEKVGIDQFVLSEMDNDLGITYWPVRDAIGIFCPENENPREYTTWTPER